MLSIAFAALCGLLSSPPAQALTIPDAEVRDRIEGGWVGAVIGGAWGEPTEFRFNGRIVPANRVPRWSVRRANRYTFATSGGPDETYVEIPFLRALERDVLAGWPEWGRALRRTRFVLFAENRRARRNLRAGIPAPASGDFTNNPYAHDIGFQIESDFAGLVAPAQGEAAVDIAWRAGHVIGYGDGVYGGLMLAAMHAEAFRAEKLGAVIEAGRRAVPRGTPYRAMIEDVLRWHRRHPRDWKPVWRLLERRWNAHRPLVKRDPRHVHHEFNIDAKLNGAYVLLGLLYGRGDFARTVRISMRAGQDSDCNPSNAAGVLGTWLGYERLPTALTRGLAFHRRIVGTPYTLRRAIEATISVAGRVTELRGGIADPLAWQIAGSSARAPVVERWPLAHDPRPRLSAGAVAEGLTARFRAIARDGNGVRGFWWSFGDLSGAAGRSPVHTYRLPGVYRATVWAADRLGRTRARSLRIAVG